MKGTDDIKKNLGITAVCFSFISLSLLLLPFGSSGETEGLTVTGILTGVLFWFGVLSGSISYVFMNRKYKGQLLEAFPREKLPRCLKLFGSPVTAAVDAVFFISMAVSIYCGIQMKASRVLEFISLFLCITSFYLHFLVTGRAFQYYRKNKGKGVKENERTTKTKRKADSDCAEPCADSRNGH